MKELWRKFHKFRTTYSSSTLRLWERSVAHRIRILTFRMGGHMSVNNFDKRALLTLPSLLTRFRAAWNSHEIFESEEMWPFLCTVKHSDLMGMNSLIWPELTGLAWASTIYGQLESYLRVRNFSWRYMKQAKWEIHVWLSGVVDLFQQWKLSDRMLMRVMTPLLVVVSS